MNKRCTRDDVYSFITKAGLEGKTFGEIQRFVVEKNGRDYDEMTHVNKWDKENPPKFMRKNRGYWNTNLCGLSDMYGHGRTGILEICSIKVGKRYISKVYADMI